LSQWIILWAWGKSFLGKPLLAAKAEGSLRIPTSDQKPLKKRISGNSSTALLFAWNPVSSLVK